MTQIEAVARGKPEPVISGPSQVDGIARFALRAKYDDLTAERREQLKVSILDAVACAINALGAPPIEACRAQADELGGPGGRCTLVGGGRANPLYAAFYNTALIRYVDFMDSYLARGGLCHPSDNTGAILAVGEHADLSGKDFLTALAVAYQVEAQLTASVPFMAHGFDLTTQLSYSLAAGLSKALGLDDQNTAAALGICGDFIPLLVARTTPISQWKGLSSSHLALGCFHGVLLASRGVTGPRYVVEGTDGLAQALGEQIRIDWDCVKLDAFDRLALKSYNTADYWPGVDPLHARAAMDRRLARNRGVVALQGEPVENGVKLHAVGRIMNSTEVLQISHPFLRTTYLGPVTPRDADGTPWKHPSAKWETCHCEIGVVGGPWNEVARGPEGRCCGLVVRLRANTKVVW